MNKRAFTLVEVLVVVGIVVLLVALLLPVIFKAREQALTYACLANLQVLGKCHHSYAMDYNDGIVPMIKQSPRYPTTLWYEELKPYGMKLMYTDAYGSTTDSWIQCPKWKGPYFSLGQAYAQNDRIGFKDFLGQRGYFPVKFSQIPNQSSIELMCERQALTHSTSLLTYLGKDIGQPYFNYFPTPHFGTLNENGRWVHGQGNFLFCDGHAESIHWKNNWLTMENLRVQQ